MLRTKELVAYAVAVALASGGVVGISDTVVANADEIDFDIELSKNEIRKDYSNPILASLKNNRFEISLLEGSNYSGTSGVVESSTVWGSAPLVYLHDLTKVFLNFGSISSYYKIDWDNSYILVYPYGSSTKGSKIPAKGLGYWDFIGNKVKTINLLEHLKQFNTYDSVLYFEFHCVDVDGADYVYTRYNRIFNLSYGSHSDVVLERDFTNSNTSSFTVEESSYQRFYTYYKYGDVIKIKNSRGFDIKYKPDLHFPEEYGLNVEFYNPNFSVPNTKVRFNSSKKLVQDSKSNGSIDGMFEVVQQGDGSDYNFTSSLENFGPFTIDASSYEVLLKPKYPGNYTLLETTYKNEGDTTHKTNGKNYSDEIRVDGAAPELVGKLEYGIFGNRLNLKAHIEDYLIQGFTHNYMSNCDGSGIPEDGVWLKVYYKGDEGNAKTIPLDFKLSSKRGYSNPLIYDRADVNSSTDLSKYFSDFNTFNGTLVVEIQAKDNVGNEGLVCDPIEIVRTYTPNLEGLEVTNADYYDSKSRTYWVNNDNDDLNISVTSALVGEGSERYADINKIILDNGENNIVVGISKDGELQLDENDYVSASNPTISKSSKTDGNFNVYILNSSSNIKLLKNSMYTLYGNTSFEGEDLNNFGRVNSSYKIGVDSSSPVLYGKPKVSSDKGLNFSLEISDSESGVDNNSIVAKVVNVDDGSEVTLSGLSIESGEVGTLVKYNDKVNGIDDLSKYKLVVSASDNVGNNDFKLSIDLDIKDSPNISNSYTLSGTYTKGDSYWLKTSEESEYRYSELTVSATSDYDIVSNEVIFTDSKGTKYSLVLGKDGSVTYSNELKKYLKGSISETGDFTNTVTMSNSDKTMTNTVKLYGVLDINELFSVKVRSTIDNNGILESKDVNLDKYLGLDSEAPILNSNPKVVIKSGCLNLNNLDIIDKGVGVSRGFVDLYKKGFENEKRRVYSTSGINLDSIFGDYEGEFICDIYASDYLGNESMLTSLTANREIIKPVITKFDVDGNYRNSNGDVVIKPGSDYSNVNLSIEGYIDAISSPVKSLFLILNSSDGKSINVLVNERTIYPYSPYFFVSPSSKFSIEEGLENGVPVYKFKLNLSGQFYNIGNDAIINLSFLYGMSENSFKNVLTKCDNSIYVDYTKPFVVEDGESSFYVGDDSIDVTLTVKDEVSDIRTESFPFSFKDLSGNNSVNLTLNPYEAIKNEDGSVSLSFKINRDSLPNKGEGCVFSLGFRDIVGNIGMSDIYSITSNSITSSIKNINGADYVNGNTYWVNANTSKNLSVSASSLISGDIMKESIFGGLVIQDDKTGEENSVYVNGKINYNSEVGFRRLNKLHNTLSSSIKDITSTVSTSIYDLGFKNGVLLNSVNNLNYYIDEGENLGGVDFDVNLELNSSEDRDYKLYTKGRGDVNIDGTFKLQTPKKDSGLTISTDANAPTSEEGQNSTISNNILSIRQDGIVDTRSGLKNVYAKFKTVDGSYAKSRSGQEVVLGMNSDNGSDYYLDVNLEDFDGGSLLEYIGYLSVEVYATDNVDNEGLVSEKVVFKSEETPSLENVSLDGYDFENESTIWVRPDTELNLNFESYIINDENRFSEKSELSLGSETITLNNDGSVNKENNSVVVDTELSISNITENIINRTSNNLKFKLSNGTNLGLSVKAVNKGNESKEYTFKKPISVDSEAPTSKNEIVLDVKEGLLSISQTDIVDVGSGLNESAVKAYVYPKDSSDKGDAIYLNKEGSTYKNSINLFNHLSGYVGLVNVEVVASDNVGNIGTVSNVKEILVKPESPVNSNISVSHDGYETLDKIWVKDGNSISINQEGVSKNTFITNSCINIGSSDVDSNDSLYLSTSMTSSGLNTILDKGLFTNIENSLNSESRDSVKYSTGKLKLEVSSSNLGKVDDPLYVWGNSVISIDGLSSEGVWSNTSKPIYIDNESPTSSSDIVLSKVHNSLIGVNLSGITDDKSGLDDSSVYLEVYSKNTINGNKVKVPVVIKDGSFSLDLDLRAAGNFTGDVVIDVVASDNLGNSGVVGSSEFYREPDSVSDINTSLDGFTFTDSISHWIVGGDNTIKIDSSLVSTNNPLNSATIIFSTSKDSPLDGKVSEIVIGKDGSTSEGITLVGENKFTSVDNGDSTYNNSFVGNFIIDGNLVKDEIYVWVSYESDNLNSGYTRYEKPIKADTINPTIEGSLVSRDKINVSTSDIGSGIRDVIVNYEDGSSSKLNNKTVSLSEGIKNIVVTDNVGNTSTLELGQFVCSINAKISPSIIVNSNGYKDLKIVANATSNKPSNIRVKFNLRGTGEGLTFIDDTNLLYSSENSLTYEVTIRDVDKERGVSSVDVVEVEGIERLVVTYSDGTYNDYYFYIESQYDFENGWTKEAEDFESFIVVVPPIEEEPDVPIDPPVDEPDNSDNIETPDDDTDKEPVIPPVETPDDDTDKEPVIPPVEDSGDEGTDNKPPVIDGEDEVSDDENTDDEVSDDEKDEVSDDEKDENTDDEVSDDEKDEVSDDEKDENTNDEVSDDEKDENTDDEVSDDENTDDEVSDDEKDEVSDDENTDDTPVETPDDGNIETNPPVEDGDNTSDKDEVAPPVEDGKGNLNSDKENGGNSNSNVQKPSNTVNDNAVGGTQKEDKLPQTGGVDTRALGYFGTMLTTLGAVLFGKRGKKD